MSSEELKPCPFCGSPAMADSGFAPAESIIYAFCSNNDCRLHSVDVGLSPEEWNQRALPAINPQPPTVAITWHDSPESVHRAMWEESAVAAGMTYEQMIDECVSCGEDEHGNEIEFTHEQEIAWIRRQGCWAFVDARSNIIHAWADESASRELVLHMLAHEIGHITGEAHTDYLQEEMRAEQFGRVAKAAYGLLPPISDDYDALHAEAEALQKRLTTEQGNAAYWKEQYQALRNDYQRTVSEKVGPSTELEAARRGISEAVELIDCISRHPANRIPVLDQARAALVKALTATPAPEVQSEQGERQEVWARQCDLDESDPALFVSRERVEESGYTVRLTTAPQPGPDVRALVEAMNFACKSLCHVTSSDGSGHADIALSVLRMAGVDGDERERLVEGWKASCQWRIDKAHRQAQRQA